MDAVYVVHTKDGKFVGVFTTEDKCQQAVYDYIEAHKSKDELQVTFTTVDFVPGVGNKY